MTVANTNERNRFWLVWCPTGGPPTVRHSSADSAEREASRLARVNPGQEFYALVAFAGFRKPIDEPNRLVFADDDDIPF